MNLHVFSKKEWIGLAMVAVLTSAPGAEPVDFETDIKELLEVSCLKCHHAQEIKGELRLETRELALKGGKNGKVLVPGNPDDSPLYTSTLLPPGNEKAMPPEPPFLTKLQKEKLRQWIEEGAVWPANFTLQPRAVGPAVDEGTLVASIYSQIVSNATVKTAEEMKAYTNTIPGTTARYSMVPIPGGEFDMGSPESEADRNPDEGPVHRVKIDPFWMGQCEVTWSEFELFMYPAQERKLRTGQPVNPNPVADAVTRPSSPYVDLSFGMGKERSPAISMTQHAANKYCEWLSSKTGHFYRLPTEAEWEYACRAGTSTAYFFGDDPAQLGEYAWFADNSNWKYQKVGTKKPNPWGLYDMHGNVAEWCLDQYDPEYYKQFAGAVTSNPWNKATKPYPHVVRGGSWDDDPDMLRSAIRRASDRAWKMQDPQLPKSVWYHTDAQFLGFRIIRPLQVPPMEQATQYWNSGVEKD